MTIDDDTLMAYADGELDPAQRAAIARAIEQDPELATAVARHQALRRDVFAAFAPALDEAVPARLQPQAGAAVHHLDAVRAARARAQQEQERTSRRRGWPQWAQWGGMAASLAVGVFAGAIGSGGFGAGGEALLARGAGGEVLAGGHLARALDRQLAQDGQVGDVRVGLSFASREGGYCRSFQLGETSGLACRQGGAWRIPVLADTPDAGGAYRQAAAQLPPAVLDAVDARIAGSTLDATAERAARERGWQPPVGKP